MVRGWMKRTWRSLDHDPQIDVYKNLWRERHIKESDFAMIAGLSLQTVKKMFSNETRRPQGLTYWKMAKALGKKYVLVDDDEHGPIDYDKEIPKARAEYREYLAERKTERLVETVTRRRRAEKKKRKAANGKATGRTK